MQTPSKVVEISPARGRDERSLKWIAMACVIVYLVSLGSIFGMAMMAVQASKEVHVSESGALVGADSGQPVAVDPITNYHIGFSYELPFLPMAHLANVASLEFKYVDANNVILPAAYQIHAVRKTAEGRATFLTAVGDTITVDGSNEAAFLESDGVSHKILVVDGHSTTNKDLEHRVAISRKQIAAKKARLMSSNKTPREVSKVIAELPELPEQAIMAKCAPLSPAKVQWEKDQASRNPLDGNGWMHYDEAYFAALAAQRAAQRDAAKVE